MDQGTCAHCDAEFEVKWERQLYCSSRCREAAKYLRQRASGSYDRKKAAKQQRYIPSPPRPARFCDMPDCDRKHLAKGLCSKHYGEARRNAGMDGHRPELLLQGMASLHGAYFPKLKTIRCKVFVGLLAWCPCCHSAMGATAPASRICHVCATTVQLNEEEVSWVISETHSIRRLRQTA